MSTLGATGVVACVADFHTNIVVRPRSQDIRMRIGISNGILVLASSGAQPRKTPLKPFSVARQRPLPARGGSTPGRLAAAAHRRAWRGNAPSGQVAEEGYGSRYCCPNVGEWRNEYNLGRACVKSAPVRTEHRGNHDFLALSFHEDVVARIGLTRALAKLMAMHMANRQFYRDFGWGEKHW
jgi:hypothetical protein